MVSLSVELSLHPHKTNFSEGDDPLWQVIWKCPTTSKLRFFLWLVGHEKIMSNVHCFLRGLTNSSKCKDCPGLDEDGLHILRDCKHAVPLGRELVPHTQQQLFFTLPLKNWLVTNLTPLRVWELIG